VIGADPDFAPFIHAAGGAYTLVGSAPVAATVAACNGVHTLGFHGAGGPGNKAEFWVTQVYRTVDYGFGSAGGADPFTHLVGAIAGAFIGSNLLLREMPRLSAFMRARAQKWLRPDEYETTWRAWQDYRHGVSA
jgi:hypothetical protein